jgi:3-dehydroquinate dehydratase/shikimate dehydrogenase
MPKICLCLTGSTFEQNLKVLDEYRRYIDLVELRADCLLPDERFFIRSFPERAGIPVILTARRKVDGGFFESGESYRVTMLSNGLAFADADRRRNFAYIDMEEDLDVPGLEEAARTFGTRIIRSCHNTEGMIDNIAGKLRKLRRIGDEIVKVAVTPHNLKDVARVFREAKETADMEKILICMGPLGASTRILAAKTGSFLSYCSAAGKEGTPPGAAGQLSPSELTEVYRFREIGSATKIFGLAGYPLRSSHSPHIFNTAFRHENINAVYLPFPSDNIAHFLVLAEELEIAGAGITVPHKEKIIPFLKSVSEGIEKAGACNTILPEDTETGRVWNGRNTDMLGFSESLLDFIGKKNLRGLKITVLGAGGAAKAVVAEIHRLSGKCLVMNRNPTRAKDLALSHGFKWSGFDGHGLDMMGKFSDIIVQATSVGMAPNTDVDPFDLYDFTGREIVMDLIYKPPQTAFLRRAAAAGCKTLNGFGMLVRQAKYQYQFFCGKEFPLELVPRIEEFIKQYPG